MIKNACCLGSSA